MAILDAPRPDARRLHGIEQAVGGEAPKDGIDRAAKHLLLAQELAARHPHTDPQILYQLDRVSAAERFGSRVAEAIPEEGLVDVHRYLTITVGGHRISLDATFPGVPWDGVAASVLAAR